MSDTSLLDLFIQTENSSEWFSVLLFEFPSTTTHIMHLHPHKCLTLRRNVACPILIRNSLLLSGDLETSFCGLSGSPDVS